MDLEFTPEQEMLRQTAREFLKAESSPQIVRAMEADERGYATDTWKKIADLGWLGLPFPEKYGGGEGTFLDVCALIEEMGRALLPAPYIPIVVNVGLTLLDAGSEEQKKDLLPRIANGELVATLALLEEDGGYAPEAIQTTARREGANWVLDGTKLFVQDGGAADLFLVAARVGEAPEAVALFLVGAGGAGISRERMDTISKEQQYEVRFAGVRVGADGLVGGSRSGDPLRGGEKGWPVLAKALERAWIAQCIELVGASEQALDITVEYVKNRIQFGKPIGTFQAIQHKAANMYIDVEGARYITYRAAWMLSEGLPAEMEVAQARAWVAEASRRVMAEAHQSHGAIGFTMEYDLQLYSRRQRVWEARLGGADTARELVAQHLGM
jgi:alkylation response protein AidB-like acyl-CoA dehydrogenase